MRVIGWLVLYVIYGDVQVQCALNREALKPDINVCVGKTSCGECLAAGPRCAFCTSPDYDTRNLPRCDVHENHSGRCQEADIVFPESQLQKSQNSPVKNPPDAIQIQPQVVNINIRPNDPQRFDLTFRLAENYPVDLYYLMDLSHSMRDDKAQLAAHGPDIANALKAMTDDVRMGFGSFVDKLTLPYSYTDPNKIDAPCTGCVRPYGYKNELALDTDINKFVDKVSNAPISGNLDTAEGGSDAIMQALSCKDQIGWRTAARRLLLFSSDADFHYAGDGKLGGIVERNDGACHLDANGYYTKSLEQDYPSLGQIATHVKQKDINLIFAVTKGMYGRYKAISDFIQGSEVGNITQDSSDIVSLVQDAYRKTTSKVTMLYSEVENVTVKFYTDCNGKKKEITNTNTCENIQIGESITFMVEVEVKSCPKDPSQQTKRLEITPVGLTDRVVINLNYICQCDCEKTNAVVPNSPRCSSQGTEVCGTCQCNDGYFGKKCECDASTDISLQEQCKNPKTQAVCSDRGYCSCGTCDCFTRTSTSQEKYSGQWCECDDFDCPFHLGKICGGPGHGICKCGRCNCTSSYSGEKCDCPTSTATCMARGNKPGGVCNGKGRCVCGKCECEPNYRGATCEDCPDCNEVCRQYRPCVECLVHNSGSYSQEECKSKCTMQDQIEQVDEIKEGFKTCEFKDASDCRFYFSYIYEENNQLKIFAKKAKDCPEKVNVLAIVLPIIIVVVLIGIIAIVAYKVVMTIYDRRQLAQFEKQVAGATWKEENPTYKDPVRHYKNPTYAGNQ